MNATNNEVLIRCKLCATACAPWLSHCRKCGASMGTSAANPAWTDGQANRELLDSLDQIGGAGVDLADREMFKMLDEIEHLAVEKARASDLLGGSGQAIEPKLNPRPSPAKTALLAEQFKELPESFDTPSFLSTKAGSPTLGAEPSFQTLEASPNPFDLTKAAENTVPLAPVISKTLASNYAYSAAIGQAEQSGPSFSAASTGPANSPQASMVESKEVARPERVMELGKKKVIEPEKFLAPDFFDPRDRKPPKKWGRWLALCLLIGSMTLLAGYLVMKSYRDAKPAEFKGIGDLTKPATR
jgi:hypothetical protein